MHVSMHVSFHGFDDCYDIAGLPHQALSVCLFVPLPPAWLLVLLPGAG